MMTRLSNTTPTDMKEFEKDLRDLRMGVIKPIGREEEGNYERANYSVRQKGILQSKPGTKMSTRTKQQKGW